jgi:predicted DCC family thiol-disulfide oxidoreductase YuxK
MPEPLHVYYDGGCPVCSREIAFYRTRPGTNGFTWVNVNACDGAALGPDLTRDQAIARMHVRLADGRLVSGAAAFAAMWRQIPGFRWLGCLLAVPPFGLFAEIGYLGFLTERKLWRR